MEEIKRLKKLPIWDPNCDIDFTTGMQYHAPFIVTQHQQRSDLGQCIISTFPPHIVCKIHSFKTHFEEKPGKDGYNQKFLEITNREEILRQQWLDQRNEAITHGIRAEQENCSVRDIVEGQGRVYDQEFDEPRVVVKVPGLNAYLELIGCLDPINEPEWDGDHGIYATLEKMALWAQNIWDRQNRRPRASSALDFQPLDEWHEDYDPNIRPMMTHKKGLGHTYIDPSRRPELQHSLAPSFDRDNHAMVKMLKRATADLAADGIAPENYGK